MNRQAAFSTPEHQDAANAITAFFRERAETQAVLLLNSCTRRKASAEICLDIAVLVRPEVWRREKARLEADWGALYATDPVFTPLQQAGGLPVVHFDFFNGVFVPRVWKEGDGPDGFELEIGNHLVYSTPLWQGGDYLSELRARWLPYYGEDLQRQRAAMAAHACRRHLASIPPYVKRGLHFAAFNQLYRAFPIFLQALFIVRRTYPMAYNKWIREQVEEILGEPELSRQLPPLLKLSRPESDELIEKAQRLETLLTTYVAE
jgi:hypothetical protein